MRSKIAREKNNLLGLYFSGTGNTRYCLERFVKGMDASAQAISIENPGAPKVISSQETIVFAYPVYFSNLPKIVHDFIEEHAESFRGKKIYIIATMALFSGDGTGCGGRLFEKCSAQMIGGLHLQMPDSISDSVFLKTSDEKNKRMIQKASRKIDRAVARLKAGNPHQEGLGLPSRLLGLLVQRLWFRDQVTSYHEKPDVDEAKCTGCGLCSRICPMKNITVEKKAVSHDRCTLCYRCVNQCPERALTILGKKIYDQYIFSHF